MSTITVNINAVIRLNHPPMPLLPNKYNKLAFSIIRKITICARYISILIPDKNFISLFDKNLLSTPIA